MQAIIITGIAVFIGSNFIPYFLKENIEYRVVSLDVRKYIGDFSNLSVIQDIPSFRAIFVINNSSKS